MSVIQSSTSLQPAPGLPNGALGRPLFSVRATVIKWVFGMAVLAVLSFVISTNPYYVNVWTSGLMFAGLALAWNIIGGFGGQFSLGHAVFFGVGAYSAILLPATGMNPWVAILAGVLGAALLAGLIAAPLFRLRGHFFAIATLALTVVALALANYFPFTGGPHGVRLPYEAIIFYDPSLYVWLMLGFVGLVAAVSTFIKHTRLGFSLFAVRDDQDAARAMGVNPQMVKLQGLLLSAAFTGLGGGLFVHFVGFIEPKSGFNLEEMGIRLPLLVLIGGIGTIYGPVIGALLVQPAAEILRGQFGGEIPGLHLIILAVILVLAARFFPKGIAGALITIRNFFMRKGWYHRGQ